MFINQQIRGGEHAAKIQLNVLLTAVLLPINQVAQTDHN